MTKKIYKVAFTGKLKTGKTTSTEMLEEILRQYYPAIAVFPLKFAAPIYDCLHQFGWVWEEKGKPRRFMQKLGDLAREEFGDDIFEKLFEQVYNAVYLQATTVLPYDRVLIVVDDVRFVHEAFLLKELGFDIIKVERLYGEQDSDSGDPNHRSEVEIEEIDKWVDSKLMNDGSLDDLRESIEMIAIINGWIYDESQIENYKRTKFSEESCSEDCRCSRPECTG